MSTPTIETTPFSEPKNQKRIEANRANAQLSTGPTSDTGKAKSSLNAVKTALTGRTILLPTDDAAEYERHIRAYEGELKPVGQLESDLVQSIADTASLASLVSRWPSTQRAASNSPKRSTITTSRSAPP